MKTVLDYYSSSDFGLVVTLSLYYPIDSIDKANPQRAVFNFKRDTGMEDIIARYWSRTLQIEPQIFLTQIKNVRTRLYEN